MTISTEQLFENIFYLITEPLVVVKADAPSFTIIACNEAYKKVSNTTGRDIIGKSVRKVYEDIDSNSHADGTIQAALEKAINSKAVVKLEAVRYDILSPASNEIEQAWWQAEYVPITGAAGTIEYLLCTTRNITHQVTGKEAQKRAQQQEEALQREKALTEQLKAANLELHHSECKLKALNIELEERVKSRTEALALSEDNFRNIILQAPVAMGLFTGQEMTLQVINDKFLELWDKSKEIIGKPLLVALPEMKDQPYYQIMQTVLATGKTYYGRQAKVMLHRNGRVEEGYYNFINQAFKDAAGNNTGVIVVAIEVTAQVEAQQKQRSMNEELIAMNEELTAANDALLSANEELAKTQVNLEEVINELAESEARLTGFFMQAPAGICILDGPDFVFELINPVYQQLLPGRNLLGKPISEALPELKRQPVWDILQQVYRTGELFKGNAIYIPVARYENGPMEDRYFNFIYQPRKDAWGKIDGILVFVYEVTEQVTAAQKVQQAEELLRFAVEAASIGTWSMNIATRAFRASVRMKEIYGYGEDEPMAYENALLQIPDDYKATVSSSIEHAIANSGTYNVEHPVIGFHDKKLRWVRALGKVNKNDNGDYSYFTGVSIDITEQKKDEIRKNDFIAMVSHELKTPLTSLKAYAQLLTDTMKQQDDIFTTQALNNINRQVNKMTTMINSFLNVARLEAGKIHLDKRHFQLNSLIEETIAEITAITQCKTIHFLPCEPMTIYADYEKIGQVINNILTNAVKYSAKGKVIEVACRHINGEAQVSVKDNGIGIAPEHMDKLFDRFYRVDGKLNKSVAGFGIGLYLSAEIVYRHNGKIWATSEIGKGSAFYFTLPLM